jgi:hypothetical protein
MERNGESALNTSPVGSVSHTVGTPARVASVPTIRESKHRLSGSNELHPERSEKQRLERVIGVGVYEELLTIVIGRVGVQHATLGDLNALVRTVLEWENEPLEVENVRHDESDMSAAGHQRWQKFVRTYLRALSDERMIELTQAAPDRVAEITLGWKSRASLKGSDRLPLEVAGAARALFIEAGGRSREVRTWLLSHTPNLRLIPFSPIELERRRRRLAPFAQLEEYNFPASDVEAFAEMDIRTAFQLATAHLPDCKTTMVEIQRRLQFAFGISRSLRHYTQDVRQYEEEERDRVRFEQERQAWYAALKPGSTVAMVFNLREYRWDSDKDARPIRVPARVTRFVDVHGQDIGSSSNSGTENDVSGVEVEFEEDDLPLQLGLQPLNSRMVFTMTSILPVRWITRFPLTLREPIVHRVPPLVYLVPPRRLIADLVRQISERGERLEVTRSVANKGKHNWRKPATLEGRVLELVDNDHRTENVGEGDTLLPTFKPLLKLWTDGHVIGFALSETFANELGGDQIPHFVATRDENTGTPYHFLIHYTLQIVPTTRMQIARVKHTIPKTLASAPVLVDLVTDML